MDLYSIDNAILDCVDMESGEILDVEALNALEMQRDAKIENLALWFKNLISNAEQIKAERDVLHEREVSARNKAESLKKYLSGYLNGTKFETPRVKISFRKSESVNVESLDAIMAMDDAERYLSYEDPTPNKVAIKQAMKSGITIPGCSLVQRNNMQIK